MRNWGRGRFLGVGRLVDTRGCTFLVASMPRRDHRLEAKEACTKEKANTVIMGSAAKIPPLVKYFMTVPELVNTAA